MEEKRKIASADLQRERQKSVVLRFTGRGIAVYCNLYRLLRSMCIYEYNVPVLILVCMGYITGLVFGARCVKYPTRFGTDPRGVYLLS